MPTPLAPWLEALSLKSLPRAGWQQRGLTQVESVAGHSWGLAWLVLNLLPAHLDLQKALSYAILHDLAEVRTGDITPADGVSHQDKQAAEAKAFAEMTSGLPRQQHLIDLTTAYEQQADEESRFVRQCDRLDMALQGTKYRQERGFDDTEFFASADRFITHPTLRSLLNQARAHQI